MRRMVKRAEEGSRHHGGTVRIWDRLLDVLELLKVDDLRREVMAM
jgi:hypothetical protein